MPNHITTILKAPAEVLETLHGEESLVDFNRVIPSPEELDKLTAEYKVFETQEEVDAYQREKEEHYSKFDDFLSAHYIGKTHAITHEEQVRLQETYGAALDWYNWNVKHWGTKWNAYSVAEVEGGIRFDTAWAVPVPILNALAAKFPDAEISLEYADEDLGSNYGTAKSNGKGGLDWVHEPFGYTKRALDFVSLVKYGEPYLPEDEEDTDYYNSLED